MAARPVAPAPSMEQFEVFFQRADLNKDGKVTGEEAVAFFQGASLPKNILAQIWMHSDKHNAGYLGRPEFYNALRLVTVAQSGRELTKEIVKAALEGPAAARIPPPKINIAATPTLSANPSFAPRPQMNTMMPSIAQMTVQPASTQSLGFQGSSSQVLPNTSTNKQALPNQFVRPPLQPTHISSSLAVQPVSQGIPGGTMTGPYALSSGPSNLTTDWFGGRTSGNSVVTQREIVPSTTQDVFSQAFSGPTNLSSTQQLQEMPVANSMLPKSLTSSMTSTQPASKEFGVSNNGLFAVTQNTFSAGSLAVGSQIPTKLNHIGSAPNISPTMIEKPLQKTQSLDAFSKTIPASDAGVGTPVSNIPHSQPSQVPWPKMTPSNIQKYTKVFVEVDKDKDGKITGGEARNLFLSWKLPREILKKVWDLSDQDGDSMLSLREFCVALYLMERYREGRPLPAMLPNSLRYDEALLQATSLPSIPSNNIAWSTGFAQALPASHPMMSTSMVNPQQNTQMQPTMMSTSVVNPQQNTQLQPTQRKSAVPVLGKHLVNQLSLEEQNSLNSKLKEATVADEKVHDLEKEIMDSKEKIDFYRTKMQELVLYKSRCDNKLNEITEKASSDKREAESLAKKYEEKYKQVGDIASKLTVEEANFRDIQERKLELYNAIVKMEQGGSADGLLQVRADRIQADLEELVKALNERCKKFGLRVKPTAMVELPFGWQPGIPDGAADWDEDWDKFEDDGFMLVKELTVEVENVKAPPKVKSSYTSNDKDSKDDVNFVPSSDTEKPPTIDDHGSENELADSSEDASVRGPLGSPPGRNGVRSPHKEFQADFGLQNDTFPTNDSHSDFGAEESSISADNKFVDESSWGATFDNNDDADSIWGFDTFNKADHQTKQSSFDDGDFGLNPIRTGSPSASSMFGKTRNSIFDESVPSTPFGSGPSPMYNDGIGHSFDSFSRFDSFSNQGQKEFARFDSLSSNRDFDSSGFFSQPETLARFDSIRSNRDTFDGSDPFATGSFNFSESNTSTPRRSSEKWNAF